MAVTLRLDNVRVVNFTGGQGSGDFTSGSFTTVAGTLLVAVVCVDTQPFGGTSGANAVFRAITPTTSGTTWIQKVATNTLTQAYTGMVGIYIADSPGSGSSTFSMAGGTTWDSDVGCVDVTMLEIDSVAAAASQNGKIGDTYSISASGRDPGAQSCAWTAGGAAGSSGWIIGAFAGDGDNATNATAGASYTATTSRSPGGSGLGPYLSSRVEWIAAAAQTSTAWADLASAAVIYDYALAGIEIVVTGGGGGGGVAPSGLIIPTSAAARRASTW